MVIVVWLTPPVLHSIDVWHDTIYYMHEWVIVLYGSSAYYNHCCMIRMSDHSFYWSDIIERARARKQLERKSSKCSERLLHWEFLASYPGYQLLLKCRGGTGKESLVSIHAVKESSPTFGGSLKLVLHLVRLWKAGILRRKSRRMPFVPSWMSTMVVMFLCGCLLDSHISFCLSLTTT